MEHTELKVSFIVPCRNKAGFVARTVETVLAQTYSPMEIVLSDQGSTDGSYDIMKELADKYEGPNEVRVLRCPHTDYVGMAGLNAHLNWLHGQITGDLVVMCSADDLNHPERVARTVAAFKEHNPSYVGTSVKYLTDAYEDRGEISQYALNEDMSKREEGFVDPIQNVDGLIGSSLSSCWSRDLYDKYGPLADVESQDVLLPFFATLERGIYFVNEPLHAYVRHACEQNTGLGGVCLAAEKRADELMKIYQGLPEGEERQQAEIAFIEAKKRQHAAVEVNNYHFTYNFHAILKRVQQGGIKISQDLEQALIRKTFSAFDIWINARNALTMMRIQPEGMKV